MTESYASMFYTDPSITEEELTPTVLEEIGRHKYEICQAVRPHWEALTGSTFTDHDIDMIGIELESGSPDFIRALAAALKEGRRFDHD